MIHGFLWDGGWGERGIIKILQSPREVSGKFCRNTTKILPSPPLSGLILMTSPRYAFISDSGSAVNVKIFTFWFEDEISKGICPVTGERDANFPCGYVNA